MAKDAAVSMASTATSAQPFRLLLPKDSASDTPENLETASNSLLCAKSCLRTPFETVVEALQASGFPTVLRLERKKRPRTLSRE